MSSFQKGLKDTCQQPPVLCWCLPQVSCLAKERGAFCQGSHCSTSCEQQRLSLCTHQAPVTAAKLVLCDMAGSPSPSVSCIRPNASPKLARRWPYTPHPITHLCAGKATQQLQSRCETCLPTSPPSANNGYSHLLFWGMSGRTYCQILAHFNYCTHFILQIIVGWTCLLGADFISVFSPQPTEVPTDSTVTATGAESAVQLCPALDTIYFYFAMTELVCLSLAFNFRVLCLDDKWYKTGNILIMAA